MAVNYDRSQNDFLHIGVPFNYSRGNPMPIDNSSVWNTKAEAEQYARSSPIAYVGQILTVADTVEGTVTVWKIADTAGTLEQIDAKNAYDRIQKLKDYLYLTDFHDLDYDAGKAFYESAYRSAPAGGCSGARCGNLAVRTFDWHYNNNMDFLVRVSRNGTRHASIGIATDIPALTRAAVESKKYIPSYKLIPFCTMDGINDAGVYVQINVVNCGPYGRTTGTHADDPSCESINQLMLPRYILDNFSTAEAACNYIRDHVNVYGFKESSDHAPFEIHMLVADEGGDTFVVEFIENETKVIDVSAHPWMTNFYLHGVTFNEDQTVAYKGSGLTDYAFGIERWNTIASKYSECNTLIGMLSMATKYLKYTQLYTKEKSDPSYWFSELVGDYTEYGYQPLKIADVVDNPEIFDPIISKIKNDYQHRSREAGDTWQTSHACVYDFAKRRIWVVTQEGTIKDGLWMDLEDPVTANHAHAYIDSWDMNSTSSDVDGEHLVPRKVAGHPGWKNLDTDTTLYYLDGKWNLSTSAGVASAVGSGSTREIVLEDFPGVGDTTVLIRHESVLESDRLVTQAELEQGSGALADEIAEIFRRLGTVFYKFTTDTVFLADKAYYLKEGNLFKLATAGTDYTVGENVPANTFYNKYTEKDVTERLNELTSGKADKATTLAGYGITDAYIDDTTGNEQIKLGSKTLAVATRSYVSDKVQVEKDRAMGVESGLNTRLSAAELRLVSRVTAYVGKDDDLIISTGNPPANT